MRKIAEKIFMLFLWCFVVVTIFSLSCPAFTNTIQHKEINVWHKVSGDELDPGVIVPLDMSSGYSACEGPYIYIVVKHLGTGEDVVVVFPNGGAWHSPEPDPFLQELQQEFDTLEEYLKSKPSTPIEKK